MRNKDMNSLLILASGKSSRFGGFPKAFSKIDENYTNVENTVNLSKKYFKNIYLCVNEETYEVYKDKFDNVNMFSIVTGQGDADSILKALRHIIKLDDELKNITICWGDAVFVDSTPFLEILNSEVKSTPLLVGCCNDENPYAWFDVEGNEIVNSHFRTDTCQIKQGLHDQSIFYANVRMLIDYLEEYKRFLGFDDKNQNVYDPKLIEIKLLNAIEFFAKNNDFNKAKYKMLSKNKVFSFNTKEELFKICTIIRKRGEKDEKHFNN